MRLISIGGNMLRWNMPLLVVVVLTLGGCASEATYRAGMGSLQKGQTREGIELLQKAVNEQPRNPKYRVALLSQKNQAVSRLLAEGDVARSSGNVELARSNYQQALEIDPYNAMATDGIHKLERDKIHGCLLAEARKLLEQRDAEGAGKLINQVLLENPENAEAKALSDQSLAASNDYSLQEIKLKGVDTPITLEFRDAPVRMVFDFISQSIPISFILDKDIPPNQTITIFVNKQPVGEALDLLLKGNSLQRKIVNSETVVVYSNTPEKRREYDELMVRTFYFRNASPKPTADLIKSILKSTDLYVDERLNMLVMRDTREKIRMAAKLVQLHDMPDPEVILEVAVAEISRGKLLDVGIQPPTQFGVLLPAGTNQLTLNLLTGINKGGVTINPVTANFSSQLSDINVLANPRIRVKNKDKAKIQIGERVPVITTTYMALSNTQTESVQYVDAGIKLEVEPTIYRDGEIAIKVGLEVSSLGAPTKTKNGSEVYRLSARNAMTSLRLKDGETQLLAGLVNEEDRKSTNGVPFISQLPLLGRLFSSQSDNLQKTEIVLSITPRIVRNLRIPGAEFTQFNSGYGIDPSPAGYGEGSVIEPPIEQPPTVQQPATPAEAGKSYGGGSSSFGQMGLQ